MRPADASKMLGAASVKLSRGDPNGALRDLDELVDAGVRVAEAQEHRARALLMLHRDEQALAAAEAALRQEPSNDQAQAVKALALASLGEFALSRAAIERCRAFPDSLPRDPRALFVNCALRRQSVCDWHDRDELVQVLRELISDESPTGLLDPGMVFDSLGLPLSAEEQRKLSEKVSASFGKGGPIPLAPSRSRLRVGFLSPEMRDHPVARLLRRICADRDMVRFEHFLYSLSEDDGSAIRKELADASDRFEDVSGWSDARIAGRIRADELDILIDTAGYYAGSRPGLVASRLAPVQATYLSVPCTLGTGIVDYRISDESSTPHAMQAAFAESLVLLPPPGIAYDTCVNPALAGTRSDHGLPESAFVWCCHSQVFKIEPQAFAIWMRLLYSTPGSVLWLVDHGEIAVRNLRREAAAKGIDPARLIFAPRVPFERHLARLGHASLFLDTFNCGAHVTALDALWMGLPVLTKRGATMTSRLCGTVVAAAGLPDLVVGTPEEYERMGVSLAANGVPRVRRDAQLFNSESHVRTFERGLIAMVERHRAGLPPDTLVIE